MKKLSYLLNIVLIGFIAFMGYKFIYDGNIATNTEDRIAVVLTPQEKAKVLGEMRGLLEATRAVTVAATSDNIAMIPDLLRPFGTAATANASINLVAKLPIDMKTMGFEAHQAMDTLADMAEDGAAGMDILATMGDAMSVCTACHNRFRLVTEDELN